MKDLDINGFLHTSQRRPLKNVARGVKQVGSICTVVPQTATGVKNIVFGHIEAK